ncbi:unnamed protein product [Euphydryas editha]|nr:unnamed protein product [Euphydryas editha]
MSFFFASYPWRQTCFSSDDPSSCANALADVLRQGMEYYISFTDRSALMAARPKFNIDCSCPEAQRNIAYLAWVNAHNHKAADVDQRKKAYNRATKSCKKALRKARFDQIW